jgi:hypothetical protein
MKQLHVARHAIEAHSIRGFLAAQGIKAEVRGEYLTSGWGELPVDVCSVWVADNAHYPRAHELLVAFLSGSLAREHRGERWDCSGCGEKLEGQFTECWSCGAERPQQA